MSLVNKDNLINILSNTKDKIDNNINRIKVENIDTIVEEYTQNTNIPISFYIYRNTIIHFIQSIISYNIRYRLLY